ncbi:MAG: NAD(P)H-nitrite reductase large subunit [Cycloclasticus pugetii]|jgi:NAD(P)H-nitrite reductase large subunit|uniref:Ferredoxin:NADH oxidoreductase or NADH oxidase n=1 Tax=Cycloclasticus zancles 78-ME TaxID=1198232 RepID=S5TW24_9GAMM|nr:MULTISPECIES: FAD-dependent oxidoreductase [Cycloclasticus]AFT67493.1 ferredoxin:NADH oxidoreductase or NADH oxidase [Cycloclasticus sp. P1]AGS39340.1 ferredoxin:NADH oxidoreductase or NADH oxidase [Cycloclasticus zancles 78-ME]MBV1898017.1 FAD-dependent oxidoreductase [Cycloclasticus sp.]MDF1828548.1 FAD-dependent oxidoreductase [Cycloclasticus pugetii]SHI43904.1 Pyridine nucleotide-disulphide oxidoreductase [Cycloclasticus pugetii]|tara:strand:- start:666 stop:1955 length:1290 start_codon:yes stop_codon:yes gene_type:complete
MSQVKTVEPAQASSNIKKYVLIGAGPASVRAAETLRKADANCSITMIGQEKESPYSRMALPYYLSGMIQDTGTHLRKTAGHFDDLNINHVIARVEKVETKSHQVVIDSGDVFEYDKLMIATGSRPANCPFPGSETDGVVNCWTLADGRRILDSIKPGSKVALLGAGFVASIIIEAMLKKGVNLTVMLGRTGFMVSRMMDETAGKMIQSWCEAKGVEMILPSSIKSIEPGPALKRDDDSLTEYDLIIVATGVYSNIEFLEGSGIETDNGILVDAGLHTSVEDVFAAGDVAQGPDFSTGGNSVHAIQPTAVDHGRIAAVNMMGGNSTYKGSLSMNVLDTSGLVSTSFGSWGGVEGGDSAVLLDKDNYKYIRLNFKDDLLVGAITVGRTDFIGVMRGLIQSEIPLGEWKERLKEDPTLIMNAYLSKSLDVAK